MATSRIPGHLIRDRQREFFNENPPLYPWPRILRRAGLTRAFKPREAFWNQAFDRLHLEVGHRILDVGCGTGIWLDRLDTHYGAEGTGIDISVGCLKDAVTESINGTKFVCGGVSNLPFASNQYDAVVSLDVLEHVTEQSRCLEEMVRVLKPGGHCLIWTINGQQTYTWNWLLDKLGVDVFERVSHDPRLLPRISEMSAQLSAYGVRIWHKELFNSFFTLALDEAIMVTVSLFERLGFFRHKGRVARVVGIAFIAVSDGLSRNLWKLLNWLDGPWRRRGFSNGFLILGEKIVAAGQALASEPDGQGQVELGGAALP